MSYEIVLVLSIIGFALAYHIWYTKKINQKLYCIIGEDCDKVIHSEHAETFGIENSVLGIIYYVFVFLMSLAFILLPNFFRISFLLIGFTTITGIAALFSIYLAGIQLFQIRDFCEYCLANTGVVVAIFLILLI